MTKSKVKKFAICKDFEAALQAEVFSRIKAGALDKLEVTITCIYYAGRDYTIARLYVLDMQDGEMIMDRREKLIYGRDIDSEYEDETARRLGSAFAIMVNNAAGVGDNNEPGILYNWRAIEEDYID